MKKKIYAIIILALCLVLGLAGCKKHEHSYSAEWKFDNDNHWHECAKDGEKSEIASHVWNDGVVTTAATTSAKGVKTYTCTICGCTKTEEIEMIKLQTIKEAISVANNAEVEFEGVVFGVTDEGIYVADSTAGAYVKPATSQASAFASIKVGDKLQVSGKLSVSTKQIFVKNASAKVVSSGNETIKASEKTLDEIQKLVASDKENYGKLFTITAAVTEDEAKNIILADKTANLTIDSSAKAALASYVGKEVTVSVTLLKMGSDSEGWIAYAFENTIKEYAVDIDTVKDEIFASITLPTEVYGALELTTSYESRPGVEFTWAVKSGEGITISDNKADVSFDLTADSNVTLTLTLKSGDKTASQDYTTVVKAVEAVNIATGKTKEGYVAVSGLVVACGISDNSSNVRHWVIIMDEDTKEYAVCSVSSEERNSLKAGDRITIIAKYARIEEATDAEAEVETETYAFKDVKAIKVTATDVAIDYSKLYTKELRTAADYQDAIDNAHQEVVLYKIVNPWLVGSGTTSYSWYQFGATKDSAANGLINERQSCFLIQNFAANGLTTWEKDFNVPTKADGAKQYVGTVLYAFSVYQYGATKWPFIVPNASASTYELKEAVRNEIEDNVETEVVAQSAGTLALPASVTFNEVSYAITWESSNNDLINASTGAYPQLFEDASVTLTAKYTCEEKECSFNITISLKAVDADPITISEAVTAGSGAIVKLNAYVAAIGTSSENADEYRNGIMLTDGKKVVYYNTTDYKVGDVDIASGDMIQIKGATLETNTDGNVLTGGTVTILSSNNTIDYSQLEVAATVSNDTELSAFLSSHGVTKGLVVKYTGEINLVGTGPSVKNPRYQINYKKAKSSAAARYTFELSENADKSLAISLNASKLLMPENEWWTAAGIPLKSGSKCFTVYGSFYAVGGYNGKTLHAWTIINAGGFDLSGTAAYLVEKEMQDLISVEEISANEAGTLSLPESVKFNSDGKADLTWETSDSNVMSAAGAYNAVTADAKVTLTAKATVNGKEITKAFTITLKAQEAKTLTITEALALEDGSNVAKLSATVAGFATGSSGTIATYPTLAMYLSDGTNVMGLDEFKGEVNVSMYDITLGTDTTPLQVGDIVELTNLTKNKQGLQCTDTTTATKTGTQTDNTWFNMSVDDAHILDSQADIDALMLTITANGVKCSDTHEYTVYKLVGTTENPLYICNANAYMMSFYYGDGLTSESAITDTNVTPGTGYTVGSGKTVYFGTHGMSLAKAINNNEWLIANSVITSISNENKSGTKATAEAILNYGYVGTMYIIQSSTGSSNYPYIMYGILGAGLSLELKK